VFENFVKKQFFLRLVMPAQFPDDSAHPLSMIPSGNHETAFVHTLHFAIAQIEDQAGIPYFGNACRVLAGGSHGKPFLCGHWHWWLRVQHCGNHNREGWSISDELVDHPVAFWGPTKGGRGHLTKTPKAQALKEIKHR
jgi:hypothetical protein